MFKDRIITETIDTSSGKPIYQSWYKCQHCQKTTAVKPYARPEDVGGRCHHCGLLCLACTGKPCDNFMRKIERMEARDRALRSYGLA